MKLSIQSNRVDCDIAFFTYTGILSLLKTAIVPNRHSSPGSHPSGRFPKETVSEASPEAPSTIEQFQSDCSLTTSDRVGHMVGGWTPGRVVGAAPGALSTPTRPCPTPKTRARAPRASSAAIPTWPLRKSLQYPLWHFLWCEWGRTRYRPRAAAYCSCLRRLIRRRRRRTKAARLCRRRARAAGTCLAKYTGTVRSGHCG